MEARFKPKYKVVMFGVKDVGKTALVSQITQKSIPAILNTTDGFTDRIFSQDAPFPAEITVVDSQSYEAPHYSVHASLVYAKADAGLLVFSLTDKDSFEKLPETIKRLKQYLADDCPIILVGNKADQLIDRQVGFVEAAKFAEENNFVFKEVSAKNYDDVSGVFQAVVEEILRANLVNDIARKMRNVGPSRVNMRDTLIAECRASKSFNENFSALEKCSKNAQQDHEENTGARWLFGLFGLPVIKKVSTTKQIADKLVDKYKQSVDYSALGNKF